MMKKAILFIVAMIMMLFFTACGSQAVNETAEQETSETTPDVLSSLFVTPAPTTELFIRPSESPDVMIPMETPTPTLHEFDVDDVDMQSTPGSSCFSEIGYDSDYNILVVQFRSNGSVYMYSDFPIDEWDKFTSASSLGKWYNKHIKNKYEYERID
jgi:hypothetical protein